MKHEPRNPEVLETHRLASTALFEVGENLVRFSNGVERRLEWVKTGRGETVMIVPLIDNETVLLIREYCAGTEAYELVFPTGTINRNEEIYGTANRELKEEVGFGARKLTKLMSLSVLPGHFRQITHIVLAEELYEDRLSGDEPEPLEQVRWELSNLESLFERQDFRESRSVTAVLLVDRFLRCKVGLSK